jgi:hypothetical protein
MIVGVVLLRQGGDVTVLIRTLSADIAQMRRPLLPARFRYAEVRVGSGIGGRHPGPIGPAARFAVLDRGCRCRLLTALPRREPQNTSCSLSKEQVRRKGAHGQTLKHIRNSWKNQ